MSKEGFGLSKAEIQMRKKMAAKFGHDSSHLSVDQQSSSQTSETSTFDDIIRRKQIEEAAMPKKTQ
jgi:hypothetical protein